MDVRNIELLGWVNKKITIDVGWVVFEKLVQMLQARPISIKIV